MRRVAWILTAGVLGAAGCASLTSITHVGAQDRFEKLYNLKLSCKEGAWGAECRAGAESELLELAEDARTAADRSGDERERIRLLRIAGTAAWQGGPQGVLMATRIAEDTVPSCRSLEEVSRKGLSEPAPVDCALLEILPGLAAHTGHLGQLQSLADTPPSDATAQALARIVRHYPQDTFLFVQRQQPWADSYAALGAPGRTYIETSRRRLFCDTTRLQQVVDAVPQYQEALGGAVDDTLASAIQETGLDFTLDCAGLPALLPPPPF